MMSDFYSEYGGDEFFNIIGVMMGLMILINLYLCIFVPNLVIKIKTKGATPGIELMKEPPLGLLFIFIGTKESEDHSGFLEVMPWVDTDLAIQELGTMIDDIQTLGDAAIAMWKQD